MRIALQVPDATALASRLLLAVPVLVNGTGSYEFMLILEANSTLIRRSPLSHPKAKHSNDTPGTDTKAVQRCKYTDPDATDH
jgi:hypothetical protein